MCDRQKISCANCLYGDYWHEPDRLDAPEKFGFDCSYPALGSKLVRKSRPNWDIDDENLAAECLEYLSVEDPLLIDAQSELTVAQNLRDCHRK